MNENSTYHDLKTLPDVKGRLRRDVSLARYSWFRTGGPADVMFEPEDEDDLIQFLSIVDPALPITLIGVGSNLLVSDEGVDGIVIRLGKKFSDTNIEGEEITAGAGAMDVHVARQACDAGIAGLEWLVGVPGTIGGAIRMNAGAYDGDVASSLVRAKAVNRAGEVFNVTVDEFGFSYRNSKAPKDWIFLSGTFRGTQGDPATLRANMQEISATREDSQPIGTRTGGSTFKNPDGYKAWQLIDDAGCRGLRIGDAMMSEKHCNFLINMGAATAADVSKLGETVRDKVLQHSGVALEWEIRRIGRGF